MNTFIAKSIEYYRTVLLFLGLFLFMGTISYVTLPKEATPDIKIPTMYVSVIYDGLNPQDGERLLIRPLEKELRNIDGLKEMKSTAFEGGVNVILEFRAGFQSEKARSDVRDGVDRAKPKFPSDTKEPVITEINLSELPVLLVKLTGDAPKRALVQMARALRDEIESRVSSVLKVEVAGDLEDAVEIVISPEKYEQYGMAFDQIFQRLQRDHLTVPVGPLEGGKGRFGVQISGVLNRIDEIAALPVFSENGKTIRLCDIAQIHKTFKDPKSIAHDRVHPGEESKSTIVLEVSKRTGEHLIDTLEKVKRVVADVQKTWPDHISVNYAQDRSKRIRDMLSDLQNNIIMAVLLVIGVVTYALGWRSSLLVGFAVPGSFLMGVMVLGMLGYTINIVVLFSLIFSVGMLVDGAVIVVEYADRRMREGCSLKQAYHEAAIRMAWPVITSTLTILIVFLPLLSWPGIVGQFMKYMPITLIAVLTASILMALIFLPALTQIMSDWSPKIRAQNEEQADFLSGSIRDWYMKHLERFLDQPKRIIGLAVLLLILIKMMHGFFGRGVEFFPDVEPEAAQIIVHARGALSIWEKEIIVKDIEHKIADMKEFKSVYTRVGEQSQTSGKSYTEDTMATLTLEFVDWQERPKAEVILANVEARLKNVPGVWIEITKEKPGPPSSYPIYLEVRTQARDLLMPTVQKIKGYLEKIEGLKSVSDDGSMPRLQWDIQIDRTRASQVGSDMALVGKSVRLLTGGSRIGTYRPDDATDEVDILLRFPKADRTLDGLNALRLKTPDGNVPLSAISNSVQNSGVGKIQRTNGYAVQHVTADLKPGVLAADKIAEIQTVLKQNPLPDGVHVRFKGEDEDRKETGAFLAKAFGVALFLVAAVLVTQFNSFFSMGLVLSAIIMSTIGVFIGLLVHNLAFGIVMGGIGIIALAGIIVSNNIILIDTFDKIREEKARLGPITLKDMRTIILETCLQRFRPVILTKLTTILGLLPIMFQINVDFMKFEITHGAPSMQWWVLLATCIVYGVLFASSLTLFVTPCALMWRAQKTISPVQKT